MSKRLIGTIQANLRLASNQLPADIAEGQKKLRKMGRQLESVGKSLSQTISLPVTAVTTLALRETVKYESAFAGVKKTVNASKEEYAALSNEIIKLSHKLPASAEEIAGVAEAAGQLGIEKANIMGFSRTMIDLGEATNLSANQAATQLARLANITKMPQSEFDRLGSTIVDLGNNLATTEAEIVEMGLRLAGTGAQVKLSQAEIMGFAGALTSVGVNAEAGGTAFSKVWKKMQLAISDGGAELTNIARIAGMTGSEFARAFQEDAAKATIAFVEGLGRSKDAIGDLSNLGKGWKEIRLQDALLRTAGAGDLLAKAVERGKDAWAENTALSKEAAERYKTLESNLKMLRNIWASVLRTIGGDASGPFTWLVKKAKELGEYLQTLNPRTRKFFEIFAGTSAVIGPVLVALGSLAALLGGPLLLKWAAINAIVSAGIALWAAYGDEVQTMAGDAKDYVFDMWESIKLNFDKAMIWLNALPAKASKIAKDIYEGVKTWLVDKFEQNILGPIENTVNSINDKFTWLYDKVVGNSSVPDLVEGIAFWFAKLPEVALEPTNKTIDQIEKRFEQMADRLPPKIKDALAELQDIHLGSIDGIFGGLTGGGDGPKFGGAELLGLFTDRSDFEIGDKLSGILTGSIDQALGMLPEGLRGSITDFGTAFGGDLAGSLADGVAQALETGDFRAAFADTLATGFDVAGAAFGVPGVGQLLKPAFEDLANFGTSTENSARAIVSAILPMDTLTGGFLGDFVAGLFENNGDSQAQARKGIESWLEETLGSNVVFGDRGRFSGSDWATGFWESMNQETGQAWVSVGEAITSLLGVAEDVGPQIGLILSENFSNPLRVVEELGLGTEQLIDLVVQQGIATGKTAHEIEVMIQGIMNLNDVTTQTNKTVEESFTAVLTNSENVADQIDAVRDLALSAMQQGGKTAGDLQSFLVETTSFADNQIAALMQALSQRGITSLEDLSNASAREITGVLADMQTMEIEWGEMIFTIQNAEGAVKSYADSISSIPDSVSTTINRRIVTTETLNPGGVEKLARGGLINSPTMVSHNQLAGEAGPEAVLPLARTSSGDLGVKMAGRSGGVVVNIAIDASGSAHGVEMAVDEVLARRTPEIVAAVSQVARQGRF